MNKKLYIKKNIHRKEIIMTTNKSKHIDVGCVHVEINQDVDKNSPNYLEKYIMITCLNYKDGKPEVLQVYKADRFIVEEAKQVSGYKTLSEQAY
tara:strand:+ start:176 stop:457 length:282 start_codon:yes stop_codon:yes gene_type:complete